MAKEKSDIYKRVKNGGINGSPAQMQVRIHPAGRALEWHSRGQRFDPAYLHHRVMKTNGFQDFFFTKTVVSPQKCGFPKLERYAPFARNIFS